VGGVVLTPPQRADHLPHRDQGVGRAVERSVLAGVVHGGDPVPLTGQGREVVNGVAEEDDQRRDRRSPLLATVFVHLAERRDDRPPAEHDRIGVHHSVVLEDRVGVEIVFVVVFVVAPAGGLRGRGRCRGIGLVVGPGRADVVDHVDQADQLVDGRGDRLAVEVVVPQLAEGRQRVDQGVGDHARRLGGVGRERRLQVGPQAAPWAARTVGVFVHDCVPWDLRSPFSAGTRRRCAITSQWCRPPAADRWRAPRWWPPAGPAPPRQQQRPRRPPGGA